jgi:hypothetical protein
MGCTERYSKTRTMIFGFFLGSMQNCHISIALYLIQQIYLFFYELIYSRRPIALAQGLLYFTIFFIYRIT